MLVLAATIWLAATGQLTLYIHPRYVLFTVLMMVVAAAFVLGAIVSRAVAGTTSAGTGAPHEHGDAHGDEHPHDPSHAPQVSSARSRVAAVATTWASGTVVAAAALALILVPPATLTSGTAAAREMNAGTALAAADDFVSVGGDYLNFTVKDWSRLLTQVSSPSFYEGKSVDVTGFVSADATDPENVYFVSRFIVTCCAVDAQPVGVPVYQEGWADDLEADQWVRVTGPFVANPSGSADVAVLVDPASVDVVDQPGDPYVY